ncbi:glycosyltransferase [Dyadobacter sandarakinus]|uniref:Glycosyltransferase n=1 Tax=Dyadobacter sandarakinus TaxID=2747268 RepID=A0ABX7I4X8_9BACT|nr:glycosyltransferase [Dyadobacter sandarakinus]QRR01156.1 glycosyltransferase [Dyadobacter sandarakinus]
MSIAGTIQVSILVAARNEEQHIARCLRSLDALNFPKDAIEILIGDDDSEDATALVVQEFIRDKPWFRYLKIAARSHGLEGKANVLAQLAREAKGRYFFFCDADIAVPPTWASTMLTHFAEGAGVVVGVTRMTQKHLLADFLSVEWLLVLGLVRLAARFKIPVTGMGNNMAVSREAYFGVGGYEQLGFSIIEDYALFMAVVHRGFDFQIGYETRLLNISEPVNSIGELLRQRKRWVQGVMKSFVSFKWNIILSALIVPLLLVLAIWMPCIAGSALLVHYLMVTAAAVVCVGYLKQKDLYLPAVLFWFYMSAIMAAMLMLHILPGKAIWKGREYQ